MRQKKQINDAPHTEKVEVSTPNEREEIHFYRSNEKPYGPLSNLYRCSVLFEDTIFPTSEHAYQAGKARKQEVREWLLAAPSPALVAMAAHGLYVWDVHPEWSKTKFDRMRGVLYAKFTQHPKLKELLLSTGNKRLVEVATVDNAVNRLWGEVNGKGKNMLGVLLMELRDKLRHESAGAEQVNQTQLNSIEGHREPQYAIV